MSTTIDTTKVLDDFKTDFSDILSVTGGRTNTKK